jgi:hypothetical protein
MFRKILVKSAVQLNQLCVCVPLTHKHYFAVLWYSDGQVLNFVLQYLLNLVFFKGQREHDDTYTKSIYSIITVFNKYATWALAGCIG